MQYTFSFVENSVFRVHESMAMGDLRRVPAIVADNLRIFYLGRK